MTDQPQKRKRGPGRPVLENLRNAGPRLREGERSQLHRIRAPGDVHDWFASLTAEQRGELLALARQLGLGHEHPPREWPEGVREHMEALEARFRQPVPKPLPKAPALAERLTLGEQLENLKPHHAPIVRTLQAGGTLTRALGGVWRLTGGGEAGRTIKDATVRVLLEYGALAYTTNYEGS